MSLIPVDWLKKYLLADCGHSDGQKATRPEWLETDQKPDLELVSYSRKCSAKTVCTAGLLIHDCMVIESWPGERHRPAETVRQTIFRHFHCCSIDFGHGGNHAQAVVKVGLTGKLIVITVYVL
jgi:hypothetical protein